MERKANMIFNQGFLWFSGLLSFRSCFSRSLRNLEDQNLSAHSVTSASTAACRTSCVGNRKLAPRQQFHLMYKKILPKPSSRQTSPFFFLQRSDAPYRSARAFRAGLPGLPASFEAQPPKASSTNGPQITVVPVSNACMQNLLFLLLQAFHVKGADFSLIPSPHHLRGRLVPRCFPLIFIDCLDLVGSWVSFVGFLENLSSASGIWSASLSRLSFTSSRLSFTGTIFSKSTASTRVGASTCLRNSWNFSVPFARAVTS